jgi:hypothetical protein
MALLQIRALAPLINTVLLVPDTHEHHHGEIEELVVVALLSEDPEEQREALAELAERVDTREEDPGTLANRPL